MKIIYEEGCFDELSDEMTQEELDALKKEIENLVDSGELFENAEPLTDEESREVLDQLDRIKKRTRQ